MAFKMKAGPEGPFRKNFGISPLKNYKKGYYGEGSSFKSNGDKDPLDENRGGYGTSSKHLGDIPYEMRSKYRSWKRKQNVGSDKSFNAFLNSGKKKNKVRRDDYGSIRNLGTVKKSDL